MWNQLIDYFISLGRGMAIDFLSPRFHKVSIVTGSKRSVTLPFRRKIISDFFQLIFQCLNFIFVHWGRIACGQCKANQSYDHSSIPHSDSVFRVLQAFILIYAPGLVKKYWLVSIVLLIYCNSSLFYHWIWRRCLNCHFKAKFNLKCRYK